MRQDERVGDVVARVRRHLDRKVRGALLLAGAAGLVAVLLLAWLLVGDGGWPQGTAAPLLLDLAFLVGLAGGAAWLYRWRRRWLDERSVTGSMEDAAGLPSGAVLGSLELAREVPAGISGSLVARGEAKVLERLSVAEDRLEGRLGQRVSGWSRTARNGLAILAPVLVAAAVLAPDRATQAWKGLGQPVRLLAGPVLPPLEVRPGDVEVDRGADVDIVVHAPLRDSVALHWQAAGDVARDTAAAVSDDSAVHFRLRDVRAPVRYHASAPDGARSTSFRVVPRDPLLVADVTVRLGYPSYLGRPADEYRGQIPPLTVPAGTRVEVEGSASRPLGEASLMAGADEALSLDVDGASFHGTWTPRSSGEHTWAFQDREGRVAEEVPTPLHLTVVPDSAPEIAFTFPAQDTVLPLNLRQPLVLQARDDHGIREVQLVAYRVTASGERREPVVQRLDLGGARGAEARPVLDVSEWGLVPGDTVRYHARAVDNAPSAGEATSREWILRMPGSAELRRDAGERLEETAEELGRVAEDAVRSQQRTRDLERQAGAESRQSGERGAQQNEGSREESGGFQQREDVRQAVQEQSALEERVDSLRRELEAMSQALEEAGEADPELREDMDQLRELMEEIVPPEARDRLQEMLQDVDGMEAGERQEMLQELQEQQRSFQERVESSLERFRRAAVEQDFRATTAEAEELARQEEALAEELRSGEDAERRAEQQEELREEAEAMEERMERLEQRLQELGETDAAREVQEGRERSAQADGAMEQAGQEARQGRPQEAGDRAEEASEAMGEVAEQLREAQQQMASEKARAFQEALRQTADDALSLARRQSEIREEMTGADSETMGRLQGDVSAVQQGVRNLADQMGAAAAGAGGSERELSGEMGQAMEALERSVEAMEGGAGASSPRSAAEQAVDALNRLAQTAMDQALQMEQGGDGSQGMSAEGLQDQLQDLAQQQGSLNNQAGMMMPMQLGANAMESQARQMADGQQSVADQLQDLAGEPGSQEQALGDLDALAQEAGELARELAGGRLDAETRQRQEDLFRRLLDAGRSLERDEYSDEREASSPGAFERGEVQPLSPQALGALMYRMPAADVLQRLSPGARQLVIEYFQRLNRRSPDSGGDPGEGG